MRCAAGNDNSVSGNRAMIFSSAARAESKSCASLICQSASWFIAAATCLGGGSGWSQKWFNVISARRQILQILGLDGGQQHDAFEIVRKFGELLANGHNRLQEIRRCRLASAME